MDCCLDCNLDCNLTVRTSLGSPESYFGQHRAPHHWRNTRLLGHHHHQMAPQFLKDLRRRSKASFMTDKSTDSNASNITVPTSNSSSTVDSGSFVDTNKIAPPSGLASHSSYQNLQGLGRQRPQMSTNSSNSNRTSVSGMAGLGSPQNHLPVSPYAPRILSIADGSWASDDAHYHACQN